MMPIRSRPTQLVISRSPVNRQHLKLKLQRQSIQRLPLRIGSLKLQSQWQPLIKLTAQQPQQQKLSHRRPLPPNRLQHSLEPR
jgi:hypothetical protein